MLGTATYFLSSVNILFIIFTKDDVLNSLFQYSQVNTEISQLVWMNRGILAKYKIL